MANVTEEKELLRFVTIGSVDDGKSTLIGRLLHDAHGLYDDQLNAVRRASLRGSTRGEASASEIDFSLFTDGLSAEREQGITIDVAYRYFATAKRKFIIADTPGHVQYTRNMATGASTADVAVILVDARRGVLSQTRRHARIAALFGVSHVIACVNKMDLVGYDETVFTAIRTELEDLGRALGTSRVFAIPVSALRGDNIVTRSDAMGFWSGPSLLEHLEDVEVTERSAGRRAGGSSEALRLPIQLVLRPHQGYRGFAGKIASGSVRAGDDVVILPSGKRARIRAVDVHGTEVPEATAPMNVTVRLTEEIDVSRGDMLASIDAPPEVASEFEADVVWMNERPLDRERSYLLKHTTRTVRAEVPTILDVVVLDEVPGEKPETTTDKLVLNDIARVRIRCRAPIFFDPYVDHRATGAFILIDSVTNDTVAAGMIRSGVDESTKSDAPHGDAPRGAVSVRERRQRLGQGGAVLDVRAPTPNAALELAYALERELFDRGRVATVVARTANDDAHAQRRAAEACAHAGIFAIVASESPSEFERHEVRCKDDAIAAEARADASIDAYAQDLGKKLDDWLRAHDLYGDLRVER